MDTLTAPLSEMCLSRRQLLTGAGKGAAAMLALCALPAPARALLATRQSRSLSFEHTHTGETLSVTYWENGRYVNGALEEINQLMRDHRSGDVHVMDPRLLDSLTALQLLLEVREPYQIVSAYRSPATNAKLRSASKGVARRSMHMEGKAIDIILSSRDTRQVRDAALELACGGVGYYPNFVHMDTGAVRSWG